MALRAHDQARRLRDIGVPTVEVYRDVILDDLLRAIGDVNARAEQFARDEYGRLGAHLSMDEDPDPGDIAEAANANAISFGLTLLGIRRGLVNLAAAGLFHLLEQQLDELWNPWFSRPSRPTRNFTETAERMARHAGIDLRSRSYWPRLDELRLVANVAKHGEGGSATELRKRRPDLFEDPSLPGLLKFRVSHPVRLPLAGEGLYVTEAEFRAQSDAVLRCLRDLADQFEAEPDRRYPGP